MFYQLCSKTTNSSRAKGYKTLKNTVISCLICKICLCLKLQNIDKNRVFYHLLPKDYGAVTTQLAPILKQWFEPSCQRICYKTLFYTHLETMVWVFLPNNVLQNTVNYSVVYPFWSNGSNLLAKEFATKHCFTPILKQWYESSCQTMCSKTL